MVSLKSVGFKRFLTILVVLVAVQCLLNFFYNFWLQPVGQFQWENNIKTAICSNYSWQNNGQFQLSMQQRSNKEAEKLTSMNRAGNFVGKRIDNLLLIRKLVINSVQLLNKKTAGNPLCVKWWANPLTTWKILSKEIYGNSSLSSRVHNWKLNFQLEPGRIPVIVELRQKPRDTSLINLEVQQEFELISVKRMDVQPDHADILNCLCKSGSEEAERRSMEARNEWNKTDAESIFWPPDSPFLITDYVNFLDKSYFLKSPGKYANNGINYCGPAVRIILLVHSAPLHFKLRAVSRKTYGNKSNLKKFKARLVFFLGTVEDADLQNRIDQEVEEFDDIVQANFVDCYQNNTLKQLSLYQWIYLQCTGSSRSIPRHILKADDDIILNVESAVRLADANPKAALIGNLHGGSAVRATDWGKWYLPRYIYSAEPFHGYLSGGGYLLRGNLVPELLQAALTTPLIHVDDVYIAGGVLTREMNVITEHSELFTLRFKNDTCFKRMRITSYEMKNATVMLDYWKEFSEPLPENCSYSTANFNTTFRIFRNIGP